MSVNTIRQELGLIVDMAERLVARIGPCKCNDGNGWHSLECEWNLVRGALGTAGDLITYNLASQAKHLRRCRDTLVERDGWKAGVDPDGELYWSHNTTVAAVTVRRDLRARGCTYGGIAGDGFFDGGTFAGPVDAMEAAEEALKYQVPRVIQPPPLEKWVEFGTMLRAARRQAGLSYLSAAGLAGVSAADVSAAEHGRAFLNNEVLEALATGYGIEPAALLLLAVETLRVSPCTG